MLLIVYCHTADGFTKSESGHTYINSSRSSHLDGMDVLLQKYDINKMNVEHNVSKQADVD